MSDIALLADSEVIDEPEAQLPAVSPERIVALSPAAFMPAPWEELQQAAQIVASAPGLSPRFKEPDAAMFVAYQAARFGADPYALASKMYFTKDRTGNERIGYEAQWVMALIESDPLLQEPLLYEYGYSDPTKPLALNRFCKCTGKLLARSGRVVTRSVTSPTVAQIGVKNSPLWFSDTDQQLAYYTGRLFGRRVRPARILGVYTHEEIQALEAPIGRPALFEEEDGPKFDTIGPTDAQTKAGEKWENRAKGEQDTRDPRDAPDNRASDPAAPPSSEGNEPPDLAEIRAWGETERVRITALTDMNEVIIAGKKMQDDKRWRRLKAYDQADSARIVRSIRNRIDELEAG